MSIVLVFFLLFFLCFVETYFSLYFLHQVDVSRWSITDKPHPHLLVVMRTMIYN